MQSSRVRLMLVALFGVLALGALTAAAAQAVEAPRWSIGGVTLGENETHYVTAKIYTTSGAKRFTLTAGARKVTCLAARLNPGVLLGSSAGNAGKNNEVIEFFGNCEVIGNGEPCKVNEPIVTHNVKSELVETEKAVPGTSGSLLTLFEPENPAEGFVTLGFTGAGCTATETIVSGKVAAQVLTDPENGELGKLVELPKVNSTEAKSWLLNAPSPAITRVGRIKGGVLTEENIKLTAFSVTATLTGTALVLLAKKNTKGEFESETTLWSPLP
jgi:hypothetical protein